MENKEIQSTNGKLILKLQLADSEEGTEVKFNVQYFSLKIACTARRRPSMSL
jgi:hypothetical protein